MSNIDTTNIDEKDKSNYILGYEFGILESYVKDTFEIVSGDKTVFKYIASIKTNLKCFAENSSNNEKEILCNIKALCDIMSKLNALLNNNSYSAIKLDEINQIKEQLARVCKAYINCNILINNIR